MSHGMKRVIFNIKGYNGSDGINELNYLLNKQFHVEHLYSYAKQAIWRTLKFRCSSNLWKFFFS